MRQAWSTQQLCTWQRYVGGSALARGDATIAQAHASFHLGWLEPLAIIVDCNVQVGLIVCQLDNHCFGAQTQVAQRHSLDFSTNTAPSEWVDLYRLVMIGTASTRRRQ